MVSHDLTYEKRFLDWLGYSIIDKDENTWIINDDNNKEVGYIEYCPLIHDSKECTTICDIDKKLGYHMVIDSDKIKYNSMRDEDHKIYWFDVKGVGSVCLRLGEKSIMFFDEQLSIFSDVYGDYHLHLSDSCEYGLVDGTKSLKLNYNYKINGYDVTERTFLRNKDFKVTRIPRKIFKTKKDREQEHELSYQARKADNWFKGYRYSLSYYKDEDGISSRNRQGQEIDAWCRFDEPENIHVTKRNYENPMDFILDTTDAKSIEEFAISDGRGIELFNRLRELTNTILPFKVDIFYEILKDHIEEYGLEILFGEEKVNKLNK